MLYEKGRHPSSYSSEKMAVHTRIDELADLASGGGSISERPSALMHIADILLRMADFSEIGGERKVEEAELDLLVAFFSLSASAPA